MLENQKAVVIGGSSWMGLETAELLAENDAYVVIASRSEEKLSLALRDVKGKAGAKSHDFTQESAVGDFFGSLGPFDHLVLMGAGLPAWGRFGESQTAFLKMPSRASLMVTFSVRNISPGLADTPAYNWMSEGKKRAFFEQMGGDLPVGRIGGADS
jgi:hypothetical protein